MKKMKRGIAGLLAAVLLLGTMACSAPQSREDTVISQIYSDIVALDPARMYDGATMEVLQQVTEGILAQQMDGSMAPYLAETWKAVDETTYVYTMRSDVTFSDGTPMTMEDVLFSLQRHRDPAVASYMGWMFENVDTIEQTGDWEFTVKLKQPDATWQYVLGTAAGAVIQKKACEAAGDRFGSAVEGLVGTGPYTIDGWTVGSELRLSYNPQYWNRTESEPDVKHIVFTVITEDTTRISALISGQTDIDLFVPGDLMDQVEASEKAYMKVKNTANTLFLGMNCSKPPFDDVNVRRAVTCAVPKQEIHDNIIRQSGEKASSMPMSNYLYTFERASWEAYAAQAQDYAYDLEQAGKYLEQSAYPNGFQTTLITDETGINNAIALVIQQALGKIGIEVTIERMSYDEIICHEFGEYVDENGNHTYAMGLFEWEADWPDPSGNIMGVFNSAYIGEGGSNVPGYSNAEVDALLNRQAAILDEAERTQLLQQALDILIDECPIVPISYTYLKIGMSERIRDFDCVTWGTYYKDMKLK